MKNNEYGLRKLTYPKNTCHTKRTNSEYRLKQLTYPKYNAQRNKRIYRENFIIYLTFIIIMSIAWIVPMVCIGYTTSPLKTLIFVLVGLSMVTTMCYKVSDGKTINNITITILAIMSLGPIIPIHYTNGIQYSTQLNKSVIKITNGIKDNHNMLSPKKSIDYNDIYQGGSHEMNADIPSNAVLSPDPASFIPISIIEQHGWIANINNWISDQRKIGIQVTQQSHQFTILANIQDWISFRDTAISPNMSESEYNAQQEKNQQHDTELKATLSTGLPI